MNRRRFIQSGTAAALLAAGAPSSLKSKAPASAPVRIGIIGTGLRGTGHLRNLLYRDDVNIPAICDIDTGRIPIAQNLLREAGHEPADAYTGSETAYQELLRRDDLDGVIIATPWIWHFPMAMDAMKAGVVPGLEVAGAFSVQECWDLVETYESSGTPMMFLENVCYRRDVMAVLNMVRQGLFGEMIHAQCGYQHDLREVKFARGAEFGAAGKHESVWRTAHSLYRNGDLYPTHGLGPVSVYFDINRGNRFVSLTSTATKSRGLHEYIVARGGEDHPNARLKFKLGDIVTTMINCSRGETILVQHDTNLPRPYSLGFRLQGTRGLWMKDGDQLYIEGTSPESHRWEPAAPYLEKYDHPLWKRHSERAVGSGHGGMDFFVLNAFVETLKRGVAPPLDVYDAAAWSVITPLSEQSIAEGGAPQAVPDFTRGRWMARRPAFGFGDEF